ncbi:Vacuolar morphogenesis protein 6 [Elasticomyces elasticus]|nr:Vacuolar morphogenesis protein 6 [Elasticomyces elasticus]
MSSLFTRTDGTTLDKRQIPFGHAPIAIGYSYPYLLALDSSEEGAVQIRNPDTLSLLQTVDVPGATLLYVPAPGTSLAHAGKGFLVASDHVIWRMKALRYDYQLAELVGRQSFDEAISLLNLLEDALIQDKAGRISDILLEKAIILFHQQKYRPALGLFTEARAAPDCVIALYPSSIAVKRLPHKSLEGIPDSLGAKDGSTEPAGSPDVLPARYDRDDAMIEAKMTRASSEVLKRANLKMAVRCLFSFLAQARKRVQKYLGPNASLKDNPYTPDGVTGKLMFLDLLPHSTVKCGTGNVDWQAELLRVAKLVDTTLFRAYMLVEPSLVSSLCRIENFCNIEGVESALYASGRYDDLVDFLHGKKLHRRALEMFSKLSKAQASGKPSEAMRGPKRTISYLKRLAPELFDIILEFANARKLPRKEVVEFLGTVDRKLQIQYLEHVIKGLGEKQAGCYQQLMNLYLQELKADYVLDDERRKLLVKLVSFLRNTKESYDKRQTFEQLPSDDPDFYEARAIVLGAMGYHKEALQVYVFQIWDYRKAEAYCASTFTMQQAQEQASLLARRLELNNTDQSNAFTTLVGLYLNPPVSEHKHLPQALELLSKHGARLPASSTLHLMPDDLALKEIQGYLCGCIKDATCMWRQAVIVRSLEGVRRANTERVLLFGRDSQSSRKPLGKNRRVRIGGDDQCNVCHIKFGLSAIRVYPDNEVLHYGCLGRSTTPAHLVTYEG